MITNLRMELFEALPNMGGLRMRTLGCLAAASPLISFLVTASVKAAPSLACLDRSRTAEDRRCAVLGTFSLDMETASLLRCVCLCLAPCLSARVAAAAALAACVPGWRPSSDFTMGCRES